MDKSRTRAERIVTLDFMWAAYWRAQRLNRITETEFQAHRLSCSTCDNYATVPFSVDPLDDDRPESVLAPCAEGDKLLARRVYVLKPNVLKRKYQRKKVY